MTEHLTVLSFCVGEILVNTHVWLSILMQDYVKSTSAQVTGSLSG